MLRRILPVILLCTLSGCFFWGGYTTFSTKVDRRPHLKLAQQKIDSKDYAGAIEDYEAHIENRLQSPDLSSGENPYFYKALIGDLYLKLDKPEDARASYTAAKEHNVDNEIVADRFRQLGRYYAKHNKLDQALVILKEHRTLDPLMFDHEIDQVHRQAIRIEDEAKGKTEGQPADSFAVQPQ